MTWSQLIGNWVLGNQRDNLPPIIDLDSKLVKHCNKGSGNRMRGNMVTFMRVFEMEAHEKSCWKNNKRKWTNECVRNMIDEIQGDFTKKYMRRNNQKCEILGLLFMAECLGLVHSEQQREQEKKSSG